MDTALIIGVIAIISALFAWFLNRLFTNIDKKLDSMEKQHNQKLDSMERQHNQKLDSMERQMHKYFEEIKAENREIRNQVYNHIPTQIRELEREMKQDKKEIEDKLNQLEKKLDRLIEKTTSDI